MDRRTLLGLIVAALAAGTLPAEVDAAELAYPDTVEGQAKRLEALTSQVEERFESLAAVEKRSEKWAQFERSRETGEYRTAEERVYVHKTYINGQYKAEGETLFWLSTPRASVDEFERHFLPEAARHKGEIIWRLRPQLRTLHDPRTGETMYCVRHRCSFGDSPDSVTVFPERTTSDG
jgi:hypothetical protein